MDNNVDNILTSLTKKSLLLSKSDDYELAIKTADKGLDILKGQSRGKYLTHEFNLNFVKSGALWNIDKVLESLHLFAHCIDIGEKNFGDDQNITLDKLVFCYLVSADLITNIKKDPTEIRKLFKNAETLSRKAKRQDSLIFIKHLKTQTFMRIGIIEESLPLAEASLAEKRLEKGDGYGCKISCYIGVYATILHCANKTEQSLKICNEGLSIESSSVDLNTTKALIYFERGEYDKAIEQFSTAISYSDHHSFYLGRAWCHHLKGDMDQCRDDITYLLEITDNDEENILWYSFFCNENNPMKRLQESGDDYQKTLASFWLDEVTRVDLLQKATNQPLQRSSLESAYLYCALKVEQHNKPVEAKEFYQKALDYVKFDSPTYFWLTQRVNSNLTH